VRRIDYRLSRLESAFVPPVDTWEARQLLERIEDGRKRVAAHYGRSYQPVVIDPSRRSVIDCLHAGRERARRLAGHIPGEAD
jgi:hypothetical protein